MRKPLPETATMKISDVKSRLSGLVNAVYRGEQRILIEKAGIPVAALVSIGDLERLVELDAVRAERRRLLDATRAPFLGVPADDIEREVAEVMAEVRDERGFERESTAKSA
ncbi:MAG: type II toxin-antitoxin system Phd/YefM family antitoxin [Thermomicrobiales bacterium]|nr:type II toxin-antitoxin system Phd/YefM family antitoxin [Thermomicrobiales bacterium]